MKGLYSLAIFFYGFGISLFALFNKKAATWRRGRKNYFQKLPKGLDGCIWVHCASLGEFEQGRPIIEALKEKTNQKILLTFFSPSGYEIRKDYDLADAVVYLPLDTPSNARKFLDHFRPSKAIFVKYEVWHNFYRALAKKGIPTYMVSAIFRQDQIYFKPYGGWFLSTLKNITHIFCQNSQSEELLQTARVKNTSVAGDTRFDRVVKQAENFESIEKIESWIGGRRVIVAGSTWPADDKLISNFLNTTPDDIAFIIAPHEIKDLQIKKLADETNEVDRFSQWNSEAAARRILVVDHIGLLSRIYSYGIAAYIGGGFGAGIHNTLEAAVYGIPVVFGPKFKKFQEAVDLVNLGAATSISDQMEFDSVFRKLIEDEDYRKSCGEKSGEYVKASAGATDKILREIID